jgi:hypothetical protein
MLAIDGLEQRRCHFRVRLARGFRVRPRNRHMRINVTAFLFDSRAQSESNTCKRWLPRTRCAGNEIDVKTSRRDILWVLLSDAT